MTKKRTRKRSKKRGGMKKSINTKNKKSTKPKLKVDTKSKENLKDTIAYSPHNQPKLSNPLVRRDEGNTPVRKIVADVGDKDPFKDVMGGKRRKTRKKRGSGENPLESSFFPVHLLPSDSFLPQAYYENTHGYKEVCDGWWLLQPQENREWIIADENRQQFIQWANQQYMVVEHMANEPPQHGGKRRKKRTRRKRSRKRTRKKSQIKKKYK